MKARRIPPLAAMAWLALLATVAALPVAAAASGPRAVARTVEASMLVTGTIDVDEAGIVERFVIDDADKIPPPVAQLLQQQVPQWRFEPTLVEGRAAAVHTPMRIRIAANRVPGKDDAFALSISGASFGGEAPGESVSSAQMDPPFYPRDMLQRGITGTAFLLLKVARDGTVDDVVAEQVNLRTIGTERQMRIARQRFAKAAIDAARNWTFEGPTRGPDADAPFWTVRVPVDFHFNGDPSPAYGQWNSYVPGPKQLAPWDVVDTAIGADAFAAGGVYHVGNGSLRLVTPLMGRG